MNRRRIREAGDMIASQPGPVLAQPTLIDLLAREIEKMNDSGAISHLYMLGPETCFRYYVRLL